MSPLFESTFIKNLRIYYHTNKVIEKHNPGIPSRKNGKGLPPKILLTPGTYNKNIKIIVYSPIPPSICLLKPEYVNEI
jgi:hypothetical protein